MKILIENKDTCLQAPEEIYLKVKKTAKVLAIKDFISQKFYVPREAIRLFNNFQELTDDATASHLKYPAAISILVNFPSALFSEIAEAVKENNNEKFLVKLIQGCELLWSLDQYFDEKGWALIHYACFHGANVILKNLYVSNQKSVNLATSDGWTPLMLACSQGHTAIVKTLLAFGRVKVNKKTWQGTALHKAVEAQQTEIVKILLEHGADIKLEDSYGKTCMELPTNDEILELIPLMHGQSVISQTFHIKLRNYIVSVNRSNKKFSKDYRCSLNISLETGKFQEHLLDSDNNSSQFFMFKKKIIKLQAVQSCLVPISEDKFYFKIIFPTTALKYWVGSEGLRDQIVKKIKKISDFCRCKGIGLRPQASQFTLSIKASEKAEQECKLQKNVSLKEFAKVKTLGSGSFGVVYLIKHLFTNEFFALKCSNRDDFSSNSKMKYTIIECEILKAIKSPFVVRLYWAMVTSTHLNLILEYCPGSDLARVLMLKEILDDNEAVFVMASIVLGLEYLHKKGIVCRDLKPANVLIDAKGYLKICDFGLAQNGVDGEKMNANLVGSPSYLSPEGILKNKVGKQADVWALGVIAYRMLAGNLPFLSPDIGKLYDMIVYQEVRYPSHMTFSGKSFVKSLLERDPALRPTIQQVKKHEFFRGLDWKLYSEKKYEPPKILLKAIQQSV